MATSDKNSVKEIVLASPRGFCAGVDRAIDVVNTALRAFGKPLYVKHEIVHNRHVVENFIAQGVAFIENLDEVPEGCTVIFSAHGVSPMVIDQARNRRLNVIDATCPLVTKVHLEAKRFAREGYQIFLIGHKNHVEAIGTQGEAPDQIHIVESVEDVDRLEIPAGSKIAYLTQTTLSVHDTANIIRYLKQKFPEIEGPGKSDICYATTNRQEAVESIAREVELILVIGSRNSSNSNRLRELATNLGTRAYLIDNSLEIQPQWLSGVTRVGVTSGASAPEALVQQVISCLKTDFDFQLVREVSVKEENISFKLPKNLLEAVS